MSALVPVPDRGRRFSASRRVRWGDADVRGRLRLDSVARYLQDVANDDTRDAGHDPAAAWVVRRTEIEVRSPVTVGEQVELTTFCGGLGSRWAERRTSVVGTAGGRIEVAALWVQVDARTGRPTRLDPGFVAAYGEAAGGREVSARLRHDPPPDGGQRRPWPLRSTDFDRFGHVNNAATWEAVEDELDRLAVVPVRAELEYRDGIGPADAVDLVSWPLRDGDIGIWLTVDGALRASAVIGVLSG